MEVASLLLGDVLLDVVDTRRVGRAGSELTDGLGRAGSVYIPRRHLLQTSLGTKLSKPRSFARARCCPV